MKIADRIERDRQRNEALRLQIEQEELRTRLTAASNARRAAEIEAVKLGLRIECDQGCGRQVSRDPRASPTCPACRNAAWMRSARAQGAIPIRGSRRRQA